MDAKKRLCTSNRENGAGEFDICALEDILEASHDGLFIADGLGNIEMVNSAGSAFAVLVENLLWGKTLRTSSIKSTTPNLR